MPSQSHDVIIAGCVAATRLVRDHGARVPLVERGRQGRLLAVQPTVPTVVWVVVLVGGALLVGFNSLLGARSYALRMVMTGALCASGALVIVLIVSLDSPFRSDFPHLPGCVQHAERGGRDAVTAW